MPGQSLAFQYRGMKRSRHLFSPGLSPPELQSKGRAVICGFPCPQKVRTPNLLLPTELSHFSIDHAEALVPSRSCLRPRRSSDAGNSWGTRGRGRLISDVCINVRCPPLASPQPQARTGYSGHPALISNRIWLFLSSFLLLSHISLVVGSTIILFGSASLSNCPILSNSCDLSP